MAVFLSRLILFLALCIPFVSHALSPEATRVLGKRVKGGAPMTLSEVNAMPPPCHAIGMGEIDGVFWSEGMKKNGTLSILERPEYAMANNAVWFHHYCWGLLDKHRAFASVAASDRSFLTRIWRQEMEYIVNWTARVNVKWEYLPLIHKEIAETYLQDKNYGNALRSANTALSLNADIPASYALLADIYVQIKDKSKALATVTEGLKRVPASKALQFRYKDLGGGMPFPEPYVKKEPEPAPAPEPVKEASTVTPSGTTAADVPPVEQPPGNPYCRFCP